MAKSAEENVSSYFPRGIAEGEEYAICSFKAVLARVCVREVFLWEE
ncbi:MAG: hypothetical protein NC099_02130 [Corallococcus sp.]|nr:hypothetical protein [Corallococcus sp.]